MSLNRRSFLTGGLAGTAATALGAGLLTGGARADAHASADTTALPPSYPFHGKHQAGVLTPPPARKQNFACFAAWTVVTHDRPHHLALKPASRWVTCGSAPGIRQAGRGRPGQSRRTASVCAVSSVPR